MTNEEKAKRIALDKQSGKASGYIDTYLTAYESEMKMAQWKDEQFKKVIEYAEICYGVFSFNQREDFINKIKKLYEGE